MSAEFHKKMQDFINSSPATVGAYLHCWELILTGKFEKSAVASLRSTLSDWRAKEGKEKLKDALSMYSASVAYFRLGADVHSWKDGIKQVRVGMIVDPTSDIVPLHMSILEAMFYRDALWPNKGARDKAYVNFKSKFSAGERYTFESLQECKPEIVGRSGEVIVRDDAELADDVLGERATQKTAAFAVVYGDKDNTPIKGRDFAMDFFESDLSAIEERIAKDVKLPEGHYQAIWEGCPESNGLRLGEINLIASGKGQSVMEILKGRSLTMRIKTGKDHMPEIHTMAIKPKFIFPVEETNMSTQRKLVRLTIIDSDSGLKVEHSMVHTSEPFVSEDDNQTTIMQYLSEQPMTEILAKHNNIRKEQVDETILKATGNTVKLREVKLKDLTIEVRPV